MTRIKRALLLGLAVVLGSSLLVGCQLTNARSERASDDWSRGENLGQAAIKDSIGMAVTPSGETTYLVWVAEHKAEDTQFLHFVHLDKSGEMLAEHDLKIGVDDPNAVQIVADDRDNLHLTWVARLADVRRLFYARLDKEGHLSSYPKPISLPDASVDSYAMGPNADGGIDVFWSAREGSQAGFYHVRLGSWGDIVAGNLDLQRPGFDPTFCNDRGGTLHLAWYEEPDYGERSIYYDTFDSQERILGTPSKIASFPSPMGTVAYGPSLGLDENGVYVFWSRERRGGGLSITSAESFYVAFPLGRPDLAGERRQVHIPSLLHPQYERIESPINVRELATGGQSLSPAQFVYLAAPNEGQRSELAVAFAVQLTGRSQSIIQIALTLWADGGLRGYQIIGKTSNASLRPVLRGDAHEDLHTAWIDTAGFGAFDVYHASTAPAIKSRLNRLTGQDLLAGLIEVSWGMLQGLSFIPIALAWAIMPFALIAIYLFLRVEGDLSRLGPRIMLVVAILAYVGTKFLFRPSWLAALPLPRRLPDDVANVITFATPFLVSGLATALTWLYIKRKEFASLLPSFGLFTLCDAVITLLIYVPGVMAE